jgi:tetratricopeptide (TPR) repeat protein
MQGYHLCQVKKADHPYFIESISTNIYTIEELCFYLKQNMYLVDNSIINEELCLWIRDELELPKLYQKLMGRLEEARSGRITGFVMMIFQEIGYLDPDEVRRIQEQIVGLEIQPEDLRKKIMAEQLMKYGRYGNAIRMFRKILKERTSGSLGDPFYAEVLDSMAAAYGKLFLFEEAADCLWKSYEIVRSQQTWKRYLSLLPLFMDKESYREKLKELSVPMSQIDHLESKYAGYIRAEVPKRMKEQTPEEFLKEIQGRYRKSICS